MAKYNEYKNLMESAHEMLHIYQQIPIQREAATRLVNASRTAWQSSVRHELTKLYNGLRNVEPTAMPQSNS